MFDCLKSTAVVRRTSFTQRRFGRLSGSNHPVPWFCFDAFDTIVGMNPWKRDTGVCVFTSTFVVALTAIIARTGIGIQVKMVTSDYVATAKKTRRVPCTDCRDGGLPSLKELMTSFSCSQLCTDTNAVDHL